MDTIRLGQLRSYALWHWKAYTPEDTAGQLEITVETAAQYIPQSESDGNFYMKCQPYREFLPSTVLK